MGDGAPPDGPEPEPDHEPDPAPEPATVADEGGEASSAEAPPGTRRAVEAILMVADSPVELHLLAQVTETPPPVMEQLLATMAQEYEADDRGFVLVQVAGGYRYQSHPDLTGYVERFVLEGQSARLSSAALETLAIVAYKQPISRAQVASIRGVNVDGVVRTLEQRGYIAEIARDPGPGQAVLFGTTATFLERMGLASLDDLPPVADFVPGAEVVEALEAGLRIDADVADLRDDDDPKGPDADRGEPLDRGPDPAPAAPIDLDDPD
jgi:segregation and condensation protein B